MLSNRPNNALRLGLVPRFHETNEPQDVEPSLTRPREIVPVNSWPAARAGAVAREAFFFSRRTQPPHATDPTSSPTHQRGASRNTPRPRALVLMGECT